MSSEAGLWTRVRNAVGDAGHFDRREGNPISGVPDVSYCVDGVEGHFEMKHMPDLPARESTAVFGARTNRGMSEEQIAWFYRRLQAGGRAYILTQVVDIVLLHHGVWAPKFNSWTWAELKDRASWQAGPQITKQGWTRFLTAITGKF